MCGIAGYYTPNNSQGNWSSILTRMTDAIAHRGPDSDGHWIDPEAGIALGHRRLAIVDLSPTGYQPMVSASERFVTIFNGEIYNFLELKEELCSRDPALTFRGTSDTEIMLAAFEQWGVMASIQRFTGMYAFALWDRKEEILYLARDRMGEKPLYYGWVGNTFLFGSELEALAEHPDWRGEVNRDALALLMRHNYIPAPYSIYRDIHKLPPASMLTLHDPQGGTLPEPETYWSIKDVAETWKTNAFYGSDEEAINQLETILKDAVSKQMIADVPLGAFLSGGIDSSTIVALMQAQSSQPVKTFSVGFAEENYDEAPYARAVAEHLGTDHTEVYVTPQDALDVIPQLPTLYDEPFADPSQIPTFLIAGVARRAVTVCLSGDGGDELFAGYSRYFRTQKAYNKLNRIPAWAQSMSANMLLAMPEFAWDMAHAASRRLKPDAHHVPTRKLHKWLTMMPIQAPETLYHLQFSHIIEPGKLVLGANGLDTVFTDQQRWADVPDVFHHMTYLDMSAYLPDDVLVKVDRAAMAVSLETRVPLLDHHVVEFASRIPLDMKVRNGQGKWILRQLLYRYVPPTMVDRPKAGFGVPIDTWLRRDLREWAEALLDPTRLKNEGFFNTELVQKKWQEHLSGAHDHQYYLWNILMFQSWQERWL